MSDRLRYSYSQNVWDGNVRDVVSVFIYFYEEGLREVQMWVCENEGVLCLPRKEVTPEDANEGEDGLRAGANNRPVDTDKCAASTPSQKSSQIPLWYKDVNYCRVALSVAVRVTNGSSSLFSTPQLILLTQVYVPSLRRQYQHYVFALSIDKSQWRQLKDGNGRQKLTLNELKSIPHDQLEREDIVLVAERVNKQLAGKTACVGAVVRVSGPHQLWREIDGNQMTPEDALLRSPGYGKRDVELLFEEFVKCGYPHSTVCYQDIKHLLADIGWKDREEDIFRALDRGNNGELTAEQFILGLTAMDPMTSHGKETGEIRCRFIFKYYDKNNDGVMDLQQLKAMVQEIALRQGQNISNEIIEEKTKNALESFGLAGRSQVHWEDFLKAVGTLKFRGTSQLFRARVAIIPYIVQKNGSSREKEFQNPARKSFSPGRESPTSSGLESKKLKRNDVMEQEVDLVNVNISERNQVVDKEIGNQDVEMLSPPSKKTEDSPSSVPLSDGAFQSPSSNTFTLAQHTVKVRRSGQIIDIHHLLDMERAGEVCDTGFDDPNGDSRVNKNSHQNSPKPKELRHRLFDRFQSIEAFNVKSLPNEMVAALRYFEHEKSNKPPLNWGEIDMMKLGHYIISLCNATKELFENEPRLLKLTSPCYILGDLHGNYRDLICFEKAFWRVGPTLTPARILFLGDYVDRGDYGIEVVSYLFAQKLQNPTGFFLLRGNHEVREIQKLFTFQKECLKKFGDTIGMTVWNHVNEVFDRMPLAAIVDEKIFCIHGGIPRLQDYSLKILEKIQCPLPNPEGQNNLAWQMMWNDPVAAEDLTDEVLQELSVFGGFAYNEKRQTALVFNNAAFKNFLQKNNLTHVVRAHEVKQAGFEIQEGGQLFTVFSSSHYCGGSNEAACMLVYSGRIRVMSIDTS